MAHSPIEIKSCGTLIDELITTSMKCWHAQEQVMSLSENGAVASAAKLAQRLNKRRCELIQAIDSRIGGQETSPTPKTY